QRHAWAERRHPGLEPRYSAASRTDLDGHSRHETNLTPATGDVEPARLPETPVSPSHSERPDPAIDRWRHRAVAHPHAAASQGTSRRSQRNRVAENPEGDVCEETHLRARVGRNEFHRRLRREPLLLCSQRTGGEL